MGVFLFTEGDPPPVNERPRFPSGYRYLEISEETSYAEVSSLPSSVYGFANMPFRWSGNKTATGVFSPRPFSQSLQVSIPLLLDGRFQVQPRYGDPTVIYPGEAQRRFFDMLLRRKSTSTAKGLADLVSWNLAHHGRNPGESILFKGAKVSSFSITSANRKGRLDKLTATVQLKCPDSEDTTWDGDELEHRLFPRVEMGALAMQTSVVRISENPIADDMLGSIVQDGSKMRLTCSRKMARSPSWGHNKNGERQIYEPRNSAEAWSLRMQFPTYDIAGNPIPGQLRQGFVSRSVKPRRYNVRLDLGGVNKVLYVALPDAASAVASPKIWNYTEAFNPANAGPTGAKVYAVYYANPSNSYTTEHVPLAGDTIRYDGCGGASGELVNRAGGGYVARVEGARFAEGTLAPGYAGYPGYGAFIDDITGLGPWRGDLAPQGHVSFYFREEDRLHTQQDSFTTLVPGGLVVSLDNAVLTGSNGLDTKDSSYGFTLSTDTDSTVTVKY
ncbi:MAG: hypothetical protein ACI88C_000047 [Acidimicrobiales bacterium]|jgi:hypothetical protein